ncbi:glutaredoxin family protein [Dermacoccaceae bacterium W4C1]
MGWLRNRRTDEQAARHEVVLMTRPGCHLCDEAREVITGVCSELGVPLLEQDITTDPQLLARYGEMIPVTLIDGRQHDYFRVDEARLRAALR